MSNCLYLPNGGCVYRHKNLKCVGGCFIGDDEYDPNMENNAWIPLWQQKKVPDAHAMLISRLQNVHDLYQPKDWRNKLIVVANEQNLSWAVLDEFPQ